MDKIHHHNAGSRLNLKMCGYSLVNARTSPSAMHTHDFWQMNLCNSGTARLELNDYILNVQSGDIIILPPGNPHQLIYHEVAKFGCFSFKFNLENLSGEQFKIPEIICDAENRHQRREVIAAAEKIFNSFFPKELYLKQVEFSIPTNADYAKIMEDLLFGILRRYFFIAETSPGLLHGISRYIDQNNGLPVTVGELARHLGYSEGHLLQLVREQTGKTTKQLIDEKRIKIAKRFLHYSDFNINELADYMQFTDVIYFSRFFRKYTGEAPGSYMRRHRIHNQEKH